MACKTHVLVFLFLVGVYGEQFGPKIVTRQGTIVGKYLHTRDGKKISAFLSIPYAEPPVGELRFRAPIPSKPWVGDLDATKPPHVCPQTDIFLKLTEFEGDENCLFLNIYAPKLNKPDSHLYPVMIFIHGGAFYIGTGNDYNPDYLLDEDIVLITFNYRLGPLGFLSTGDEYVPGNNGLKDQALAIKWVYENIKAFGGDPEKITLFGESAGGASVHFHMFSPLSQGYMKAAISQSGTGFNNWALKETKTVVSHSEQLARHLDCPTDCHYKMIDCLRSVSVRELIESQKIFIEWYTDPIVVFFPVVETNTKGAFLPDHPTNILKSGKFANIPWMAGVTSEEGLIRAAGIYKDKKLIEDLDRDFNRIMGITLSNKNPKFDIVANKIRKFYFGDKKIDNTTMYNAINLYSDLLIIPAVDRAVNMHFKYSKQPVYYYVFSHTGVHSFSQVVGLPSARYGACHGDEMILQFPMYSFLRNTTLDSLDTYYSKLINKLWANFARSGNPTPDSDSIITTKWKPVETENLEYLTIGGGLHIASNLYSERIKFWTKLNSPERLNIRDEF